MKYYPGGNTEEQLQKLLNNGLSLTDNVDGGFVEFTTTGGVEEIHHNLGRVPIGWLIIFSDGPVTFYAEDFEQWTKALLSLRSSAPNVVVRLFVM